MRNVSDKSCRENQTHILSSITFFENHAIYEVMWKNLVEPENKQITMWHLHIARWIPEATNTHSEYNYGFSTATMVTRRHLSVALCVHSLSCLYWFLGPVILEIIMYRRNISKYDRGKVFFFFSQKPSYCLWGTANLQRR